MSHWYYQFLETVTPLCFKGGLQFHLLYMYFIYLTICYLQQLPACENLNSALVL